MPLGDPPLVLVVEDHAGVRNLLKVLLTSRGCRVQTATTVEAGLAAAAHLRPTVVLTDWFLSGGGGGALLDGLASHPALRSTPVIVASGAELPELGDRPNVIATIAKPFDMAEMQEIIARACEMGAAAAAAGNARVQAASGQ